jgi:hypothetical protein
MRFNHKDVGPVLRYLAVEDSRIMVLDWEREPVVGGFAMLPATLKRRAAYPAKPATIADVEFYGGRGNSPAHAIRVLKHYFHINPTTVGRPLAVQEAVQFVEGEGAPNEFLLAGHPDGGLISVSAELLPFQEGLKPITWWGQ